MTDACCGHVVATTVDHSPQPPAAASDILATVGGMQDEACVLVWRIYVNVQSQSGDSLAANKLMELRFPLAARILWHPFDPNRFLLLHRNCVGLSGEERFTHNGVATLVETKRLVTTRHNKLGHMVCECPSIGVPGALQFVITRSDDETAWEVGVNDASWSTKDARHVLTAHDDGRIRLWDVTLPPKSGIVSFPCIAQLDVAETRHNCTHEERRVTRVIFLSHYEMSFDAIVTPPFVTGTAKNYTLTLWSGFRVDSSSNDSHQLASPHRFYVCQLKSAASSPSSVLNVELYPAPYRPADTVPSSFLLLSEPSHARMHALHLDAHWTNNDDASAVAVTGFDYITTLDVVHPILSMCLASSSSLKSSISEHVPVALQEEKDVDLCCVKTKAVQMLSLSADILCAPPKTTELGEPFDAVIQPLYKNHQEEQDEHDVMEENIAFEEEYDLEEDDTQAEVEYSTADDDQLAPIPIVDNDAPLDPFSNWLGAIVKPLPPPTVPSSNNATIQTTTTVQAPPPPPPRMDFIFPPPPPGLTPSAPTAPVKEEMAFLSPMQLLGKSAPDPVVSANVMSGKSQDGTASAKKLTAQFTKKKKGGGGGGGGDNNNNNTHKPPPTAILHHEEAMGDTRPSSHPSGSNVDIRAMENAMERIMTSHVKSIESKIVDTVRKTVASEISLAMEKAAERALRDAMFHQQLEKAARESATAAAREAVSAMQAPMVTALHQISKTMDQGLAQIAASQAHKTSPTMEAMSQQMMKMSKAIKSLSSEVAQL
ncbi:hypothetical protein ACHAW6_004499 [Cyclotella cf. meneghiniana]